MELKLPSYRDLLTMSKEALDAAVAPVREALAKARAAQATAELDEQIINQRNKITKLCIEKEINFSAIADEVDELDLLVRRKKIIDGIIGQLFPAVVATPSIPDSAEGRN